MSPTFSSVFIDRVSKIVYIPVFVHHLSYSLDQIITNNALFFYISSNCFGTQHFLLYILPQMCPVIVITANGMCINYIFLSFLQIADWKWSFPVIINYVIHAQKHQHDFRAVFLLHFRSLCRSKKTTWWSLKGLIIRHYIMWKIR